MRILVTLILLLSGLSAWCQLAPLTVDKIMRDPKWIGTSPSNTFWTADGKYLLFNWNPDKAASDSVYYITANAITPQKTTWPFRQAAIADNLVRYNTPRNQYVYAFEGDIYWVNTKTGVRRRVTKTTETEGNPQFSFHNSKIVYTRDQNLYAWDLQTGLTTQLTNFQSATVPATNTSVPTQRGNQPPLTGRPSRTVTGSNQQEKWLQQEALENSTVLRRRKEKKDLADSLLKQFIKEKTIRAIPIEGKTVSGITISGDGRFITYRLTTTATGFKSTFVPNYVTESGFT